MSFDKFARDAVAVLKAAVNGVVTSSAFRPTPEAGSDLPNGAYYNSVDPVDGLQYRYQRTAGGVGYTRGRLVYSKADVGLPDADNTSDANKPVSTAQAVAITAAVSPALTGIRRGNRIYAYTYPGIVDSSTIDSADALQALLNTYPGYTVLIPDNIAFSKSVFYDSNTHIMGRNKDKANIYALSGFTGESIFVPRARTTDSDYVLRAKFENLLFVDGAASNDGRGSTSVVNGIDVTGTFACELVNVKGVRVNILVYAKPGPAGKTQWTRRLRMRAFDWGNCNWGFKFDPATDNRFAYGDFQITDTESTGSCRYGCWGEDADGFMVTATVAFSNGQLRLSGNALTIANYHAFETRVPLTAASNQTADGVFISARAGGGRSTGVSITGSLAFQTGRLADTTSGSPPQINKPGIAFRFQNVDGLNVNGTAIDTSAESMDINGCTAISISLVSLRANTQLLGSGAVAANTKDAITLTNCQGALINLVDQSPSKRWSVYADNACKGVHVMGVMDLGGNASPSQIRIPSDSSSSYSILSGKADGTYVWRASHVPLVEEVALTLVAGTNNVVGLLGRNGARGQFNSGTVQEVYDVTDHLPGYEAFYRITDNGGIRLVDVTKNSASKFKFKDGNTKLGRGYCFRGFREPLTGLIVEL